MMFAMGLSVTAMILCAFVHGGRSEELPEIAFDFVRVVSGYYDNQRQIDKGNGDYDFVQAWFLPVHVPVFGSNLTFLTMEARKGRVVIVQLHVVSSPEAGVVKTTPYNFTDPSLCKPGEFPLKELANLTLDQLHTDPDCGVSFDLVGPGIFTGKWPVCPIIVNGKHPDYALTFNCDDIFAVIPNGAIEKSGPYMYDVSRRGEKYKLPYVPDNYVGPCVNQS